MDNKDNGLKTYPVLVVSFFPGNKSESGVGGFNWYPDNVHGFKDMVNRIHELTGDLWYDSTIHHSSFTVIKLHVPANIIEKSAVDDWIDARQWLRELPAQEAEE